MTTSNHTSISLTVFYLLGIPGLEDQHMWISIPFFICYDMALLGNSLLIVIILTKPSLHDPMYILLSWNRCCPLYVHRTSGLDHLLVPCWGDLPEPLYHSGILSHFHFHESGILLVMAFDLYIAICYPLRYTAIPTYALIGKIGLTIFLRSFATVCPIIFFSEKTAFFAKVIFFHTLFVSTLGWPKYSCDDIRVNIWYGLFLRMLTIALDVFLIIVSYMLILRAVFHIPSQDACHETLNRCGSHICVIILFYVPGIFSVLTQSFGCHISPHIHILLAHVSILAPPMLNPIVYGIKTKQIRDQVTHILFSKQI